MDRRIVTAVCGGAGLGQALRALEALGVPAIEVVQVAGPAALLRLGALAAAAGFGAPGRTQQERALRGGGTLLLVPVGDDGAEKRVSLALLRHSEGPVEVRDES